MMDLFNKVHIFEPTKNYIYELNISLISLINLMFNYAKPRLFLELDKNEIIGEQAVRL